MPIPSDSAAPSMKKLLISNCVILFALVVTLFEIVGYTQSTDGPKQKPPDAAMSNNDNPALYFARVISASPATRDAYVACLQERELPIWGKLKRDGLLADVSVFEVTSVLTSERGVPSWNFLFLNHLAPSVTPAVFFDGEKKGEETSVGTKRCEDQVGAAVRRAEVLRSTPNSYYPRATPEGDRQSQERKVEYRIEYIAVQDTAADLNDYREIMRSTLGPAEGQMLTDKWDFSFIALETVSVQSSQPGMPSWNQIHINGVFPEKDSESANDAAYDAAVRRVNPQSGGAAEVYSHLKVIRTKPREDKVRQLFELAVR